MIHPAASGERAALRGYRWQYDQIAARVYDALLDGDFESLRLTDPQAGRVDDLVLIRRGRADGYQFKSVEFDGHLTFRQVIRDQRTRGGNHAPSLLRSLADGWRRLGQRWGNTHVHLVTKQLASVHDRLGNTADRPSPGHFSAFLTNVLEPLRCSKVTIDDIAAGWKPVLAQLHEASGIGRDEFEQFLRALHFDVAAGSGLPRSPSTRHSDIVALSSTLLRCVSEAHGIVELDERQVLDLMGWENRPRLHSRHQFPVDLDTYRPLAAAMEQLKDSVSHHESGYVAVIGPPGTGKSTLLSQALTGSVDRVVRYYAYVPGATPARTRRTARAFLHDIVLMLNEDGIKLSDRELPGNDVHQLRQQLADQLDAAGAEFLNTRRRTVIVVDGLDHVDRDHAGNDGLLAELPRPEELPDGVLFVVGSRTLAPLHPYARQQLEERQDTIDLQHHRLPPASVLEICRRAPPTADMSPEVHQRIVALSNGHPLALSYLLNRLRDADAESAEEALSAAPAYAGDLAAEYRAVWDDIEEDDDVVDILSVCSRLRIAFTTEWLSTWAPPSAIRTFRRKLLYLFRRHHDGLRFFHDSFRQFAADRTALGDDARPDVRADSDAHQRVARLCSETADSRISMEELYHWYCADQRNEVLASARQTVFREQYRQLRSPGLIREDITLAMNVAADRADVLSMLRLLLSLVEVDARTSALETVNMPGLLHDTGLTNEAIAWCGGETRRVPLAHAYGLAARLGNAGDPAGRGIFDLIEHDGMDDPDRIRTRGEEDAAALAWTRAAVLFRPLPIVIAAVQNLVEYCSEDDSRRAHEQAEQWRRYARMFRVLIDALRTQEAALDAIDSALAHDAVQLLERRNQLDGDAGRGNPDRDRDNRLAMIVDLRVQARIALLELASRAEEAEIHLRHLLSTLSGAPLFPRTILDAAESLASHDMCDQAIMLLDRTSYVESLTTQALSYNGEVDAIDSRFRYWRLRYLLASCDEDLPAPVPTDKRTPAGNDLSPEAAVHRDTDAIELAARIDAAARTLAKLDAKRLSGHPMTLSDAWATLAPLLGVFPPPSHRSSATLDGIGRRKHELMRIVVIVASSYGRELPQRLSDVLARRFLNEPERWPLTLRLDLADDLKLAGATTPWYRETLVASEAAIAHQDVYSRLDETSDLIRRYARDGEEEAARHLVLVLIPMAFGVGYRKDYQFDSWVAWIGRALDESGGGRFVNDAAWLARVLTAVDPMTEGAPRSAAIELPVALAPANPLAAVRIFEYLVRHGTADHVNALAALVRALVSRAGVDATAAAELAADITGELLARAAKCAYPDLARSILTTAGHAAGSTNARKLAESIAVRTDSYALPTTRAEWRQGLGFEARTYEQEGNDRSESREDDYGALVLKGGGRIARADVTSHIRTIDDIITLRREEAHDSSFSWLPIVEERTLSNDDVRALIDAFDDESHRNLEIFATLAEAAEKNGDRETALRLSSDILRNADGHSWSHYYGGMRLRAAAVAVRSLGQDGRVESCRDLARCLAVRRGLPSLLLSQLDDIVQVLDPDLHATAIWPEIRTYLEGMAETLELPDSDVLSDHGCHWWLRQQTGDRRMANDSCTPVAALAELAVGHLSHPAWLVRDAATSIVVRALHAANEEVAKALGRFAQPDASDDTLERAGRCLAAARACDDFVVPDCLRSLDATLASHPSQVIRDLATDPSPKVHRPLSPMYDLTLPPESEASIESEPVTLAPYEVQYKIVASGLGLNPDTLLAVAARYASEAACTLPEHTAVLEAFRDSRTNYRFLPSKYAASRAAFGRVLADLADARLLDGAPSWIRRLFRTVDIDVLNRAPEKRPAAVPDPPDAGLDQTIAKWRAQVEKRLEEYITKSTYEDRVLIGARSQLTVLNWSHLEEELICGTTVGADKPVNGRVFAPVRSTLLRDLGRTSDHIWPQDGESLVLENNGSAFSQPHADWLSFRPDLAAALGWTPEPIRPGCWYTTAGELAADAIWWVDGWWGRGDRAFYDTVAEGHAVIVTASGLHEVTSAFGEISRHFELTRLGKDKGADVEPMSATRSLPIVANSARA